MRISIYVILITGVVSFFVFAIAALADTSEFSFQEGSGLLTLSGPVPKNAGPPLEKEETGRIWLRTIFTPEGDPQPADRCGFKVFTHIYDFEGCAPITKGDGGKYPHHRGMFIGWQTVKTEKGTYNPWAGYGSEQRHVKWLSRKTESGKAVQSEELNWCDSAGSPYLREIRTITASCGPEDARVFDFESVLTSLHGSMRLEGNPHHCGMHVRLANEISFHEDSTHYVYPEGSTFVENDKAGGTNWLCCSAIVGGKRYSVLHMTPPDMPVKDYLYGFRNYGRLGCAFSTDLKEGVDLRLRWRIVVSANEMDREQCWMHYKGYAEAVK